MTSSDSATLVQRVLGFRDGLEEKGLSRKLFLAGFAIYLVWKMWNSTTLSIGSGSRLNTLIHLLCLALFGLAILLTVRLDAQSALLFVLLCLGVVSRLVVGDIWLFDWVMIFGASRSTDFRTVAKVWFVIVGAMTILIVLGSQVGIFVDYLWARGDSITRHGLGFRYTTYASHLLLGLTLTWVYLRKEKFGLVDAVVILGLDVIVYMLTNSRNSFAFTILIVVVALVLRFERVRNLLPVGFLRLGAQYSFIIVAVLSLAVTWGYDSQNATWELLNDVLSNRLVQTQTAYQTYGVHIFGQDIELVGNGLEMGSDLVTGKEADEDADTNYVDNGYLKTLLYYGPIVCVVFVALYVLAGRHGALSGDVWLCAALCVISLHLFIDGTFRGVIYSPFLVVGWKAMCDYVEQSRIGVAVRSKLPARRDESTVQQQMEGAEQPEVEESDVSHAVE